MATSLAPRSTGPSLPRRIKIGYGVSDLGASVTFVAINTWLLYYLINIAGLPPFRAGLVFVVGRLFDAVSDPVMGVVSDRLRLRIGRLPFVRWGVLPLGAAFALLWWLPAARPDAAFGLAVLLTLLVSLFYTVVQVPTMALTPELAPDYDERTALSSYRIGFGTLASLLAVALPPLIVLAFSPGTVLAASAVGGWLAMGVAFGGVTVAAYLTMAAIVPEPHREPLAGPERSAWADVRTAFAIPGFRQVFALFMGTTVGVMILNSMLPFYLESALRIPGPQQTPLLALLFGVAIAMFPVWTRISARLGKRVALILGLATLVAGILPLALFAPAGGISVVLVSLTVVAGAGLSAVELLPWAMLPDVVEFDELETGRRREGVVYALFTFGQKIAGSAGVFANAIAAAVFGYQEGVALQSAQTVRGIRLMVGPVAAAVFLLAVLLAARFPITRERYLAATRELERRRAAGRPGEPT